MNSTRTRSTRGRNAKRKRRESSLFTTEPEPSSPQQDDDISDDDWDKDDENLLRKTSSQNRRLFRFCHEKFGLVPDQLPPDGELVNEEGLGFYTSNWVVAERARAERWNLENPDDLFDLQELYQPLEVYREEHTKSLGRRGKDPDPDVPLQLKKGWIVRQGREAVLWGFAAGSELDVNQGVGDGKEGSAQEDEQYTVPNARDSGAEPDADKSSESGNLRTSANDFEYIDLTNDGGSEEEDD